ncbi:MAG: hypothetical protein SPE03_13175 [Treponema sp.]|nr:hypothetical protein [Treponema sp.]
MLAFYTKLYIKSTHVRLDSKILIQNTLVHIMYRKTPHLNFRWGEKHYSAFTVITSLTASATVFRLLFFPIVKIIPSWKYIKNKSNFIIF